jgi:hypothetical protein
MARVDETRETIRRVRKYIFGRSGVKNVDRYEGDVQVVDAKRSTIPRLSRGYDRSR